MVRAEFEMALAIRSVVSDQTRMEWMEHEGRRVGGKVSTGERGDTNVANEARRADGHESVVSETVTWRLCCFVVRISRNITEPRNKDCRGDAEVTNRRKGTGEKEQVSQ